MVKVRHRFIDSVDGSDVWLWIDNYNTEWLAVSRWGFRLEI